MKPVRELLHKIKKQAILSVRYDIFDREGGWEHGREPLQTIHDAMINVFAGGADAISLLPDMYNRTLDETH